MIIIIIIVYTFLSSHKVVALEMISVDKLDLPLTLKKRLDNLRTINIMYKLFNTNYSFFECTAMFL